MCYWWPEEDPKYDHSKSRAENYLMLRKLFENLVLSVDPNDKIKNSTASAEGYIKVVLKDRRYKGAHLDWNYTEMVRDLIDLEIVKVPITDFDVIFVEWASGNLENPKRPDVRVTMALYDWDGGNREDDFKPPTHSESITLSSEKHHDAISAHKYTDSNREEYIPTPVMNVEQIPQQIEYGNHDEPNFIPWQEREHTAFWVTGVAE